ncbi:hypothetical protein T484DRAFT_1758077, partial [Baffinella frigidus]
MPRDQSRSSSQTSANTRRSRGSSNSSGPNKNRPRSSSNSRGQNKNRARDETSFSTKSIKGVTNVGGFDRGVERRQELQEAERNRIPESASASGRGGVPSTVINITNRSNGKHREKHGEKHGEKHHEKHNEKHGEKHGDNLGVKHTPDTYLRSSLDRVNHMVEKFSTMPTKSTQPFKDLAATSMIREAEHMNAWFYEKAPSGDDGTNSALNPGELPNDKNNQMVEMKMSDTNDKHNEMVEIDIKQETMVMYTKRAKQCIDKAIEVVKKGMTDAGSTKFGVIKKQVDATTHVLDYRRCVADNDPDFVVMKVRSDQFKEFVTRKWSKMNAEGDTSQKEVCMKHPPCISSVHEYMPVLVPSFLMKRKPLTWMSALAEIPDLKDVDGDRQKEYYELLCGMVKAYQKVVVDHHDPFQELKINDPDHEVPYGGPDSTPWPSDNTMAPVDAAADAPKPSATADAPKPSNKEEMRKVHLMRVAALKATVTGKLETWFKEKQMEDYGFKKDLSINGFVTMVINQAATIGTHTWGKATVMCNTLEIKQAEYKDLRDWLEKYAEAFVKLHDGQYAVSHNHHLTEDEHTVQVATAIWIIDQ